MLPTTHHGHGAAVIWLDTDGRFDAARVRVVMQRILQTQGNVTVDDTGDLLSEALQHIHVFRPVSSAALLATLRSIPEYLLTCHDDGRTGQPQHYSRNRRVHSLVLDSATAFLWQDRWAAALARIPGGAEDERERSHFATGDNASDGTGRGGNLHADIVTWLREFQEQFSCMLLYTTTMTTGRSGLPYPWPVLPVLRVMVRRDAVQRFGGEMSVEAARADAEARQSVVRRGRCSGWVDLSSVPASVRQEIETRGMGVFSFRIDDRGVEIDI